MVDMGEGKLKAQAIRTRAYIGIGSLLKLFASSAGISHYRYYQIIAPYLVTETKPTVSPAAVKRYTNRGIPQNLSYSLLSNAIEQAYQSYLSSPTLTRDEKNKAEKAHDLHYPQYFSMMKMLYRMVQLSDEIEPFLDTNLRMKQTIFAFLGGTLFDEAETPSQEDLNWLRESLRQFPPKGY